MYLHSGIRNFTLCVCSTLVTGVTIGKQRATYLVSEGNVVDVCVVLTGTLRRTLDVFVNSSSGSATGTTNKVSVLQRVIIKVVM